MLAAIDVEIAANAANWICGELVATVARRRLWPINERWTIGARNCRTWTRHWNDWNNWRRRRRDATLGWQSDSSPSGHFLPCAALQALGLTCLSATSLAASCFAGLCCCLPDLPYRLHSCVFCYLFFVLHFCCSLLNAHSLCFFLCFFIVSFCF